MMHPIGLLAVIGPSRNDHFGLPRFFSRSFSNACVCSQKRRISRSSAGKSKVVSTFSKGIALILAVSDSGWQKHHR
jgi:hypothetical protein